MSIVKAIDEQIAYGKFLYYTKGTKSKKVDIIDLPSEWEFFPNSKDRWKKIDYGENATLSGCLYEVKELQFSNHYHSKSDEFILNVTEGSSFTVYTPKWNKKVKYGECVLIPKGVQHICVWHKKDMIVNIIWHPPMEGWQGNFVKTD